MLDPSKYQEKSSVQDRIVIVTGASGGMGRALATSLGREGASLVINYLTQEQAAFDLVKQIEDDGGKAIAIRADVSDEIQVQHMVQMAVQTFGRVDILINNAGISRDAISWKMSIDAWSQVLNVNLTGVFLCSKAVLPLMRNQQWGRIINISSVVAQIGVPGTVAYAASKAGIVGLTKTIAREVVRNGITVNCLALGYFRAGMMLSLSPEHQKAILSQIPMGRLGETEEVVHAVKFLCSDRAGYITGQVLNINGGLYV